jgi:uncharacterized protein YwqG
MTDPLDHNSGDNMSDSEYQTRLASLKRDAFIPEVDPNASAPDKGSRYFGSPWMPAGMEWPHDGDAPMSFVLQLDLATIPWRPEGMPETGLLLFFHAEEYNDPEDQSFVVIVDQSSEGGLREAPDDEVAESSALPIIGWRKTVDVPHWESRHDIEGLDDDDDDLLDYGYQRDESGRHELITGDDGKGYEEADLVKRGVLPLAHTFSGDKIGGWPYWEQGDDTPEDTDGTKWTYFMQVAYEGLRDPKIDNSSYAWPTWGTGHIYVHKGQFMYVWACD